MNWWDYLMATQAEMRRCGISWKRVEETRFKHTWMVNRVSPQWALSIGLWGGTTTLKTIHTITGASNAAMRSFSRRYGLLYWGLNKKSTPVEVLISTYYSFEEGLEIDETCAAVGILPIEAKLYMEAIPEFVSLNQAETFDELLKAYTVQELNVRWTRSGLAPALPEEVFYSIHGQGMHPNEYFKRLADAGLYGNKRPPTSRPK